MPKAAAPATKIPEMPSGGPSGRVRHDERGVAVWDWAVASGEFATLEHHARCSRNSKSPNSRSKNTSPPSSSSRFRAATRRADSIPTTSAAPASARAKPPQRAGVTGSPDAATVLDQLLGKKK